MSEKIFIPLGMLITWFAIFFIVPIMGYDIKIWVLIVSASIGSLIAGSLVFLGETVIENIMMVAIVLVTAGVLAGSKPGLGFIFISALLSCVIGAITNQVNQYAANKALKSGAPKNSAP